jgi:PKD repeat protein
LRGNAYDGEFVLIGKTTNTSYIDTKVEAGTTYYYVVESVDKYLNKSRSNIVSGIPTEDDDEKPVAVIKADRFSTTNTYILFDSTASIDNHKVEDVLWDFGDGTQSTEWKAYHKYSEPGDYTVSLAVYDSARNYSTTQHVIRIYDSALTSKVNIQVIDDSTALGLSNADVIVKMPDGSEESFITDESGFIYLLIPFTNEQDIGNLRYILYNPIQGLLKKRSGLTGVSNNCIIIIVKDNMLKES